MYIQNFLQIDFFFQTVTEMKSQNRYIALNKMFFLSKSIDIFLISP